MWRRKEVVAVENVDNVRKDISDKKRNKPSIEVDIKVDRVELDEAIEKAVRRI